MNAPVGRNAPVTVPNEAPPTNESTGCPGDDVLAAFVQGAATNEERSSVELHLDGCEACRDLLTVLAQTYSPPPTSESSSALPLFGSIDRYELLDIIGKGAMGTVYEARDPVLGRHLAVKVIEHSINDARLLREGRAMARVQHPNVVAVHDAGVVEGRVFIAMELVRGRSLREHLADNPSLSPEDRLELFVDAARGLAAAHAANVIHRDFKPENVVVGGSDRANGGRVSARVTDFGLARPPSAPVTEAIPTSSDQRPRATDFGLARPPATPVTEAIPTSSDHRWLAEASTQGLHGTPAYICPEQLDGQRVDERSDQFSFAVALYEALFHAHPFGVGLTDGPRTLSELRAAMGRPLARPAAASKMPAFVWPALARALDLRPAERWPSMAALADALRGPTETTKRWLATLVASLTVMAVTHVITLAFVVIAMVIVARDGPEPPGSAAETADALTGVIFFTWAPLGLPLTIASAYGVSRRRRWAYLATAIYSLLALPSCFGTPFAVFAIYVLGRPSVRRAFGR